MTTLTPIQQIQDIKYRMLTGVITYDKAREEAEPVLKHMNERGKEIARQYGARHKPITFTGVMR